MCFYYFKTLVTASRLTYHIILFLIELPTERIAPKLIYYLKVPLFIHVGIILNRLGVDKNVIVAHNHHYFYNGWLKCDHRLKYTNPLPLWDEGQQKDILRWPSQQQQKLYDTTIRIRQYRCMVSSLLLQFNPIKIKVKPHCADSRLTPL